MRSDEGVGGDEWHAEPRFYLARVVPDGGTLESCTFAPCYFSMVSMRWWRSSRSWRPEWSPGSRGTRSRGAASPSTRASSSRPGDEVIEAAEAKSRLDQGALFLDARPVDFYKMSHIPGALSLPEPDFDRAFALLEPRLRTHFNLVVYCAGYGCEASHIVARKLRDKGIHAAILNEGWPAWTDAGYPHEAGSGPLSFLRNPLVPTRPPRGPRRVSSSTRASTRSPHPAAFAKIVYQWQVLGPVVSNLVAVILPWVEAVAGVLLIAGALEARVGGRGRRPARGRSSLAAASVLARGIDVENCGCTSVTAGHQAEKSFFTRGRALPDPTQPGHARGGPRSSWVLLPREAVRPGPSESQRRLP